MVKIGKTYRRPDEAPKERGPRSGNSVLPKGWYRVCCESVTEGKTKAGNQSVKFKLKVQDGPAEGRILFFDIYPESENDTAQQILEENMTALAFACDIEELDDLTEIEGCIFEAACSVEGPRNGYGPKNSVDDFRPDSGEELDFDADWQPPAHWENQGQKRSEPKPKAEGKKWS